MNEKLNYTVQVGDFIRIHTTGGEAPFVHAIVESSTYLHSEHIITYERRYEHLVKCREDALYLNIKQIEDINATVRHMLYHYVDINVEEYSKRCKQLENSHEI